jgi:hypothetical protein
MLLYVSIQRVFKKYYGIMLQQTQKQHFKYLFRNVHTKAQRQQRIHKSLKQIFVARDRHGVTVKYVGHGTLLSGTCARENMLAQCVGANRRNRANKRLGFGGSFL